VSFPDVLFVALSFSGQRLRFIILDLFWKLLWLGITAIAATLAGTWLLGTIASTPIEGPNLDAANPIILFAVLNELWTAYSPLVAGLLVLIVLLAGVTWLILESLFRGGWKGFWVYLGSGTARVGVLCSTAATLGMFVLQDRSMELAVLVIVLMSGIWFLVAVAETVVRRDAIQLLAVHLLPLSAVMACLQIAEVLSLIILWGLAATAVLTASGEEAILAAAAIAGFLAVLSVMVHSYLLAARFSAVDIMRRNIVDG
jgi:hypothetical protein